MLVCVSVVGPVGSRRKICQWVYYYLRTRNESLSEFVIHIRRKRVASHLVPTYSNEDKGESEGVLFLSGERRQVTLFQRIPIQPNFVPYHTTHCVRYTFYTTRSIQPSLLKQRTFVTNITDHFVFRGNEFVIYIVLSQCNFFENTNVRCIDYLPFSLRKGCQGRWTAWCCCWIGGN